jgi:hypothetical protein
MEGATQGRREREEAERASDVSLSPAPVPMGASEDTAARPRAPHGDTFAQPERSSLASASFAAAREAGRALDRLLERPRTVLGVLVAGQIAATLALAFSVAHNGWVYFQGGDQIVNTTTAWMLGQLELPPTEISYLWPLVQVPITWFAGPTYVQALPPIVVMNVLVLAPVAVLCVYGIAARIGGRLLGYWAAALWVIAPFAAIPLFVERYQERWSEHFLPQALGLTAMPDYPSMVLVLAAAYFVVRSLDPGRMTDAVFAGVLAGAAGGLKPPNYLFLVGAVLAYLLARRWREGVGFAVAVAPSLLVLALWKERGLGYIPALTLEHVQFAAGTQLPFNLDDYLELDVEHWKNQMNYLREFFWSARVAQWAPFAGLLAVLRVRRAPIAALLAGWLAAFIVVKGFSPRADIQANTFWRLLMPAWPAYLLLFASIPLLVPTLPRRLGERVRPPAAPSLRPRWIVLAAIATIAVPAAAAAASEQTEPPTPALVQTTASETTILTPVEEAIELQARPEAGALRLTWTSGRSWRGNVFYRVYRKDDGRETECMTSANAAWNCFLRGEPIATIRETVYVDPSPPPGATYRIGVGTNWIDDPEQGDIFAFSPSVSPAR